MKNLIILLGLFIFSVPLFSQNVPELMYFRFENNVGLSTPNYASAPVGNNPAPITGHTLGSGGQFDSCMVGVGGAFATNNLNTAWATSLPSTGWTISMWVTNLTDLNPTYLWGDVNSSSFRCFYGGAAGANNVLLRSALFPDVLVTGVMPGPKVVHFVYNGSSIIAYKNGVQATTVSASGITISGAGPFYVGAYNGVGSSMSGSMDEFRMYNRALTPSEVAATWNVELPATGITNYGTGIPNEFKLYNNFPNPFNPVTKIRFDIPASALSFGEGQGVRLVIYDLLGREIAVLVNGGLLPAKYEVAWNAANYPSGTYIYRLTAGDLTASEKMTLVK